MVMTSPDRISFIQGEYSDFVAEHSKLSPLALSNWHRDKFIRLSKDPQILVDRESTFMRRILCRRFTCQALEQAAREPVRSGQSIDKAERGAILSKLAEILGGVPIDASDFSLAILPTLTVDLVKAGQKTTIEIDLVPAKERLAINRKLHANPLAVLSPKEAFANPQYVLQPLPGYYVRGFRMSAPESQTGSLAMKLYGEYYKKERDETQRSAMAGMMTFLKERDPALARELDGRTNLETIPPRLFELISNRLNNTLDENGQRPSPGEAATRLLGMSVGALRAGANIQIADSPKGTVSIPGM